MAAKARPQVALVVGGSVGIGRATAEALAGHGYQVFSASRELAGREPGQHEAVRAVVLDVTDQRSVETAVADVLARAGRIDLLVNAAGAYLSGALEETTDEQVSQVFEVNTFGVMRMTRAVLPAMRQQRSGRIVNLATLSGMVSVPFAGAFSASKAALEGYSEALRHEVRPFGIWVSVIQSGGAKTDASRRTSYTEPLPAYGSFRDGAIAALRDKGRDGMSADVVARAVVHVAQSASPPLRIRVGGEAKGLRWASALLPQGALEAGTRRAFKVPSTVLPADR